MRSGGTFPVVYYSPNDYNCYNIVFFWETLTHDLSYINFYCHEEDMGSKLQKKKLLHAIIHYALTLSSKIKKSHEHWKRIVYFPLLQERQMIMYG